MKFHFEAQTSKGKTKIGTIYAGTQSEALKQLKREGLKKINLKTKRKDGIFKRELSFGGVKLLDLATFTKNLAVMLGAGISLFESLVISYEQSKGKLKSVLAKVMTSLEGGKDLSVALEDHPQVFKPLYVNIVKSGEVSGNLEKNLNHLAQQLEKDKSLRSKIKGALIYPLTVLSAALVIGYILAIYVLPQISNLISSLDVELPWTTRAVLYFSNIAQNHTLEVIFGTIFFVIFVIWFFRVKAIKKYTHVLLLHIPIVKKIVLNYNMALFARTMGTLMKSGVLIDDALKITALVINNYQIKKIILQARDDVRNGVMLGDSLISHQKYFPLIMNRMISVGERSGKIDETLVYLADFYEDQVDYMVKGFTTTLEPVLLLIIGFVVAILALAIITPLYKITGNIGR